MLPIEEADLKSVKQKSSEKLRQELEVLRNEAQAIANDQNATDDDLFGALDNLRIAFNLIDFEGVSREKFNKFSQRIRKHMSDDTETKRKHLTHNLRLLNDFLNEKGTTFARSRSDPRYSETTEQEFTGRQLEAMGFDPAGAPRLLTHRELSILDALKRQGG